jgi:hypothetical protein
MKLAWFILGAASRVVITVTKKQLYAYQYAVVIDRKLWINAYRNIGVCLYQGCRKYKEANRNVRKGAGFNDGLEEVMYEAIGHLLS